MKRLSRLLLMVIFSALIFTTVSEARFFDSCSGKWTTRDPLEEGSDTNLYRPMGNNPANNVDPMGLTKIVAHIGKGIMVVDPEQPGQSPYTMSITSGKGSCMNKPKCADQKDKGPIPAGEYTADISRLSNPSWFRDLYNLRYGDWSDWNVPLTANSGTNTYGRTAFYMHGGFRSGSAGCIDFGGGIFGNDATNQLLNDLLADPDKSVPVLVQ